VPGGGLHYGMSAVSQILSGTVCMFYQSNIGDQQWELIIMWPQTTVNAVIDMMRNFISVSHPGVGHLAFEAIVLND
jgi:hypothetical protein